MSQTLKRQSRKNGYERKVRVNDVSDDDPINMSVVNGMRVLFPIHREKGSPKRQANKLAGGKEEVKRKKREGVTRRGKAERLGEGEGERGKRVAAGEREAERGNTSRQKKAQAQLDRG